MDETLMSFNMLASTSVHLKGEKTVMVKTAGHKKSNFTVILLCLADAGCSILMQPWGSLHCLSGIIGRRHAHVDIAHY